MLLTLESDYLVQTQAFVGSFKQVDSVFPSFFKEEQYLFNEYHSSHQLVLTFQDIALNYLTSYSIKSSLIMQSLKNSLDLDEEFNTIIETLWKKQGNITSTSKNLFIHHNTLQYRIDKFYDRTGLSLKNMNDLTLCYLLIH